MDLPCSVSEMIISDLTTCGSKYNLAVGATLYHEKVAAAITISDVLYWRSAVASITTAPTLITNAGEAQLKHTEPVDQQDQPKRKNVRSAIIYVADVMMSGQTYVLPFYLINMIG